MGLDQAWVHSRTHFWFIHLYAVCSKFMTITPDPIENISLYKLIVIATVFLHPCLLMVIIGCWGRGLGLAWDHNTFDEDFRIAIGFHFVSQVKHRHMNRYCECSGRYANVIKNQEFATNLRIFNNIAKWVAIQIISSSFSYYYFFLIIYLLFLFIWDMCQIYDKSTILHCPRYSMAWFYWC